MAEKSVYEQIKKRNGERFAQTIQNYDNGIFDIPGIVDIVKYAGREAEPIMKYLESLKGVHIEETGVYQDPLELLSLAGYDAYYVTNLEEQNRIAGYYASAQDLKRMGITPHGPNGERLCTFRDLERFKKYHIIHAVKKNVDQIRRETFRGKEEREDEYGTSVISIQILKTGGVISIKNRYNHTVAACDNTFGSNPDKIIPGLANALRHHFNVDFSASAVPLPDNFAYINGQIIRYNYEKDNILFGSDFYVKNGQIHNLKPHEIMLDSHIFDLRTKKLTYPGPQRNGEEDTAFKKAFLEEIKGHKVILKKDKNGQHLFIRKEGENDPSKDVEILTVKDGCITALNLPTTEKIGDHFLSKTKIKTFSAPNLIKMGDTCFSEAGFLENLYIPAVKTMGTDCFTITDALKTLNAPSLTELANSCFCIAEHLETISLPNLKKMGVDCFHNIDSLRHISLPALEKTGESCFYTAPQLETADLPSLKEMETCSFHFVPSLKTLIMPSLKKMKDTCFHSVGALKIINLPNITEMEKGCFTHADALEMISMPAIKVMRQECFHSTKSLKSVYLPALREMAGACFFFSDSLESLYLPVAKEMGGFCFSRATTLKSFYAPVLKISEQTLKKCPNRENLLATRNQDPERSGVSQALRTIQDRQVQIPVDSHEGISARLQNTGSRQAQSTGQSYSFLKRLRDWILPRQ